jgi:hypothetical protein
MSEDGMRIAAIAKDTPNATLSVDGGATWTALTPPTQPQAITISGDGSLLVLLGTDDSVYTSTDNGATWGSTLGVLAAASSSVTVSYDGSKIAVPYNVGVWVSNDAGNTWNSYGNAGYSSWSNVLMSDDGTKLISRSYDGTIHRSTNGGTTWAAVGTPPTASGLNMWGDATLSSLYVFSDGPYYVSNDDTASWSTRFTMQPYQPADVDLDPSTPGTQHTIDKTATQGWTGAYDPTTDVFSIVVTDENLFIPIGTAGQLLASYTLASPPNCAQPAPANIAIDLRFYE